MTRFNPPASMKAETSGDSDICFQLGHKYIAAPSPEGLMIIHQRRAHIRIEYERIMDLIADSTLESRSR